MGVNNINFNTDKIVIVYYPGGTGGKFLLNCLALGSNSVFQEADLATQQLNNKFSSDQKIQMLLTRLENVSNQWNDLNMSNLNYSGITNNTYLEEYKQSKYIWPFKSVVQNTVDHDNYFFLTAPTPKYLSAMLGIWPNAQLIILENYKNFLNNYRQEYINDININYESVRLMQLAQYWKIIRDPTWPKTPPKSIEEVNRLPQTILNELNHQFKEIYRYFQSTDVPKFIDTQAIKDQHLTQIIKDRSNVFTWDVEYYTSVECTIDNVMELAHRLGIKDINPKSVRCYYAKWIETLATLTSNF